MNKIPDNFNGYLEIEKKIFVYNVTKTKVSLFPASQNNEEQYALFTNLIKQKITKKRFILGCYQEYQIAFYQKNNFKANTLGLDPSCVFYTPLIIKSAGNSTNFYSNLNKEWNKFDAVTFYGGNINFIYPPNYIFTILEPENASHKKSGNYTFTKECTIDDEKIEIVISIQRTNIRHNKEEMLNSISFESFDSYIQLRFDSSKDFLDLEKYIMLIKDLITLLTMQYNVRFNIALEQKDNNGEFYRTAYCKLFDSYPNYSIKDYPSVILLPYIIDFLPNILTKIYENPCKSLFMLFPSDNTKKNLIPITNIQNLCTVLEVIYNIRNQKRKKDKFITELKEKIKETINHFMKDNSEINVYDQTTIQSAFNYLDYTLKEKIMTLYEEHKAIIDAYCREKHIEPLTKEHIAAFVKLRNNLTHDADIKGDENTFQYYYPLFALAYICVFEDMGLSLNKEIRNVVYPVLLYQ